MSQKTEFELSMVGNLVVVLTLLLLVARVLPAFDLFSNPAHYLPLHTGLEALSMMASVVVFAIAWNLRRQPDNGRKILLGVGLLVVCGIDFAHMLSYDGMPLFVTPSSPEKAINFWLAARAVAAATLLCVALMPRVHFGLLGCLGLILAGFLITVLVYWVGLFHNEWIPRTFIPGEGLTPFKVGAEYVLVAAFALAAFLLYRRRHAEADIDFVWLAAAAWVQGLAELFFTLYTDVSDIFNLLGHLYKVAAFLMIYRALSHFKDRHLPLIKR